MKKLFFLLLFSLAIPLQAASAGAASSPYYSMSIEKHNDDLRTGKLIGYLNSALPEGAVLQKTMHTEPVDGMIHGVFVWYTLGGGSVTVAPTTEALGILMVGPDGALSYREIIQGKADDLECDEFFFDQTDQKIKFVVMYIKKDTEKDSVLEEVEVSLSGGSVIQTTILDTSGSSDFIRDVEQCGGKVHSYEILRGGYYLFLCSSY